MRWESGREQHRRAVDASWPMPRKVAAALFGLVCIVGLACAAIYLSAVLFLLLNKADPRQANFGSIAHYWALYADDPRLRKTLFGSMVVSGCKSSPVW